MHAPSVVGILCSHRWFVWQSITPQRSVIFISFNISMSHAFLCLVVPTNHKLIGHSARLLSTTPAVKYGRCMHAWLLIQIWYSAKKVAIVRKPVQFVMSSIFHETILKHSNLCGSSRSHAQLTTYVNTIN